MVSGARSVQALLTSQSLEELVDAGRLNGTNFCIACMVRLLPAWTCGRG
jgi:hypothetical protein